MIQANQSSFARLASRPKSLAFGIEETIGDGFSGYVDHVGIHLAGDKLTDVSPDMLTSIARDIRACDERRQAEAAVNRARLLAPIKAAWNWLKGD